MTSLWIIMFGFVAFATFAVWLFRRGTFDPPAEPEPAGGLHITTLDGRCMRAVPGRLTRHGDAGAVFGGGGADGGGGGCGGDGGGSC